MSPILQPLAGEAAGTGAGGDFGAIRSDLGGRNTKRRDCAGLSKPGAKRRRRGRLKAGAGARSGARLFVFLPPLDAAIAKTRSLQPRFPPPHERMHQKRPRPLKTIPGPARPIFSLIFYLTSPTKTFQSFPSAAPSPSARSGSAQYHTMPHPRAAYTPGPRSPE